MEALACPGCGTENPAHNARCGECGVRLDPTGSDSWLDTDFSPRPDDRGSSGPPSAPLREPVTVGQTVSRYRILSRLGGGAMGVVYRAEDTRLRRPVALKFLPREWCDDPDVKQRFIHEAQAASALDHPNICTVYEIDETDDGRMYIAMAYGEGETLKKKIGPGGLPAGQVVDFGAQIAAGLSAAHHKEIVHRDLKPANVFITEDGTARILDFGLAVVAGQTRVTRDGGTVGTPAYMSPEQTRSQEVGPRSDLWSLGVVLYEMLTGRPPFDSDHAEAIIYAILHADPDPPSSSRPDLPPAFEALVLQALEKDASKRPASADEMGERLAALRGGSGSADHPPSSPGATTATLIGAAAPDTAPKRRLRTGALAVAALTVAIAAFVWWPGTADRNRTSEPATEAVKATGSPATGARASPTATAAVHRIGILAPLLPAEQAHLEGWPELVQFYLADELGGVKQIPVVDPLTLNGLVQSVGRPGQTSRHPDLMAILAPAELSYLIDGTFLETPEGHFLALTLTDPQSGDVLFSSIDPVPGEDDLVRVVHDVAAEMRPLLELKAEGVAENDDFRPWISLHERDPKAVKEFLAASKHIYRLQPGGDSYLRRAIETDPEFIAPRLWLISGLVVDGELAEAREHLAFLESLAPRASPFEQAMIGWADAYIGGDLAREARQLEVALEYSPGNNILLQNLAIVRYELGDIEGAAAAIGPAVEMGWSYPAAYAMLAQCQILTGRFDEARSTLARALDQPAPAAEIHAWLAGFALLDGDPATAEHHRARLQERMTVQNLQSVDLAPVYQKLAERAQELDRPAAATELIRWSAIEGSSAEAESGGSRG